MGPVRQNPIQRPVRSVHMCVHCTVLCTIVAHNIAPDNFPSYPPDNHHCSDDVYLREGGRNLNIHLLRYSSNTTLCLVFLWPPNRAGHYILQLWFLLSLPHAVNCGRFCFWRRQSVFFVCVWNISETAERICAKFTWKTCLVPRSDEFEGQDQRSRSPGTTKRHFRPFRRPV